MSVDSFGTEANDGSFTPAISGDGRFVAFASGADNLVDGDINNWVDVFVHDRQTGVTERVSIGALGVEGNDSSSHASISGDGRFVTFKSFANNLVGGDTNNNEDIFIHDRVIHLTERVSVNPLGGGGGFATGWGRVSEDGRFVAFLSSAADLVAGDTNNMWDVFVRDRQTGTTSRVSVDSLGNQANSHNDSLALSGDGRIVVFSSRASNLVPDDTNGAPDVFVHDRQTGVTSRVNVDPFGSQVTSFNVGAPVAVNYDGRFVVFESFASSLVAVDTNGAADVFVRDRQTGTTSLVSVDSFGNQAEFSSTYAAINANGRYIALQTHSSNLVDDDTNNSTDVFVHDRQTGTTSRVSVDSFGNEGNSDSVGPLGISADGSTVVFESAATNLVGGDANGVADIFVNGEELPSDPDADGVPDEVEDAAPNGGDGNDDGTPDNQQANVTSLPNAVDDQYVTLVSPPGTTLADVVPIDPGTLPRRRQVSRACPSESSRSPWRTWLPAPR